MFFGPRMNHPVTNTLLFHCTWGFSWQTGRFSSLKLNLHHSWLQSPCESPPTLEFYDGCLSGIPVELSSLHGQEGRRVVAAFFHQTGGPRSSTMYFFLKWSCFKIIFTVHWQNILCWPGMGTSAYPDWTGVRRCQAGNQRYSPMCATSKEGAILPVTTQWIVRMILKPSF